MSKMDSFMIDGKVIDLSLSDVLYDLFSDEDGDELSEITVKYNHRLWGVDNQITKMVYDTRRKELGRVIEFDGEDCIKVEYLNGGTSEIDMLYQIINRRVFFVAPRGNVSHDYLKVERGVKFLVHFTPIENIPSIMKNGICPRSLQEVKGRFTDDVRLDNQIDATSYSVSFPNNLMFYKKREQMAGTLFAVLLIDVDALLSVEKRNIAYCAHNAASSAMTQLEFWKRSLINAAHAMFDETEDNLWARENLPACFPTDPQAEILIRDVISSCFIREIHVKDDDAFCALSNMGISLPPVKIDDTYFHSRSYVLKGGRQWQ